MKANELRIGNYIKLLNKETTVGELFDDGITTDLDNHSYEYIYDLVEPIPLTEEWLLKFGFVFEDEQHHEYFGSYLRDDLNGYSLIVNKNENKFILRTDVFDLTTISYVHQLQNIFFALTGNELEIK